MHKAPSPQGRFDTASVTETKLVLHFLTKKDPAGPHRRVEPLGHVVLDCSRREGAGGKKKGEKERERERNLKAFETALRNTAGEKHVLRQHNGAGTAPLSKHTAAM